MGSPGLLERAWQVRQANFPPMLGSDHPSRTYPLSVTGKDCALDCAHCGKHYLAKMVAPAQALDRCQASPPLSWLISGGCGPDGKVPVLEHLPLLQALKAQGHRLNFHVGLVNEAEAEAIAALADAVSFDLVGDGETIREVFGLDRSVGDYVASYRALRRHTRVVPHVCIGLRGGLPSGEEAALDILAAEGHDAIVFIVFIPTPGTRYAGRKPPPMDEAVRLLAEARLRFPTTPIGLGCMRPHGAYREALDSLAVRAGVQRIVQPAPQAVRLAQELGLQIVRSEECCVL